MGLRLLEQNCHETPFCSAGEPNCYSKVVLVDGEKHIVIMSARNLAAAEELTYDYKFAVEVEPGSKIPCACGAASCSGNMN